MKTCAFLFGLLFLAACSTSSKQTIFVMNEDEIVVKICVNTTKSELENIRQQVKSRQIDFDYTTTTFSSDGKVDQLDVSITGPGFKSRLQADLFMSDEYQGFIRDYRPHAARPFRCGSLE